MNLKDMNLGQSIITVSAKQSLTYKYQITEYIERSNGQVVPVELETTSLTRAAEFIKHLKDDPKVHKVVIERSKNEN